MFASKWNILDNSESKKWVILNKIIFVFLSLSVFVMIIQSSINNLSRYKFVFLWIELIVSAIFLLEYIYRFFSAKNKNKYVFSLDGLVDLIAFLPLIIEIIFNSTMIWNIIKIVRMFKYIRLFKVLSSYRYTSYLRFFLKSFSNYKNELKFILYSFIVLVIPTSFLLYYVEWPINIWFSNFYKTFWWWIETIAKVWNWWFYPMTFLGKIIWVFYVLMWLILFWMISSISFMVLFEINKAKKLVNSSKNLKKCMVCNNSNKKEANYCINCWDSFIARNKIISDKLDILEQKTSKFYFEYLENDTIKIWIINSNDLYKSYVKIKYNLKIDLLYIYKDKDIDIEEKNRIIQFLEEQYFNSRIN